MAALGIQSGYLAFTSVAIVANFTHNICLSFGVREISLHQITSSTTGTTRKIKFTGERNRRQRRRWFNCKSMSWNVPVSIEFCNNVHSRKEMVEGLLFPVCCIRSLAGIRIANRQAITEKYIMQISPYTIKCRTLNTIWIFSSVSLRDNSHGSRNMNFSY
jgi:hypothetical protein